MTTKLAAAVAYIAPRVPSSAHLRLVVPMADFEVYRVRGRPLIGCGWRKSAEFAYPDGMTEREWASYTRGAWRHARPWLLILAGDCIAAWVLVKAAWSALRGVS